MQGSVGGERWLEAIGGIPRIPSPQTFDILSAKSVSVDSIMQFNPFSVELPRRLVDCSRSLKLWQLCIIIFARQQTIY